MSDGINNTVNCLSEASQTPYIYPKIMTDHSVTINIAPYFKYNNQRYDLYTESEQKQLILNELYEAVGTIHLQEKGIDHIWEKTAKGNIHMHALFSGWEFESMITLQKKLHKVFSYKNIDPKRTFYYERTRNDSKYWYLYMQKDQHK